MGKIRTKVLGSEVEQVQKQKDEVRREAKKERKVAKLKGKGGGRITDMTAEEVVVPQVAEEVSKATKTVKKEKKAPKIRGKKFQEKVKLLTKGKLYPVDEAIKLVKQTSYTRFIGSVEAHINTKEKGLSGSVALPHQTGKQIRVAVASEALIEKIQAGKIDFDILVAAPVMMPRLAKFARILGPKGLMPNPKNGTISIDPKQLALSLTKGLTQWKTEAEAPIVHFMFGKTDFEEKKLKENLEALILAVNLSKINSVFIKATMGPAIKVNVS